MAEENEKVIEKDRETITPAGAKKDELSEEDVEKVAGGGHYPQCGCGTDLTIKH
ncbi:MAG TPA: hypothetical protein VKO18_00175 [Terriglobia bacterium]|nr:hypothetical protein [Terriglobia bacterium]